MDERDEQGPQDAEDRCRPGARLAFEGPAWNGSTVALIAAAKAHTEMVLLQVVVFAAVRSTLHQELTLGLRLLVSLKFRP